MIRNPREVTEVDLTMGQVISEMRKGLNMTQKQLAAATGVTFQQIQKYEKGTNRISVSRLFLICNTFGISPISLMSKVEERMALDSPMNDTMLDSQQKLVKTATGHSIVINLTEIDTEDQNLMNAVDILLDKIKSAKQNA